MTVEVFEGNGWVGLAPEGHPRGVGRGCPALVRQLWNGHANTKLQMTRRVPIADSAVRIPHHAFQS